ncbi:NAD(P)-dependent oxidoreductase [Nocardioides mangrovicus]|uniref:NAD(P)-dependent oxidoreductase n=1 Tax=Nocardioides mangrovicus TaxID=2478913 RepID=A0A3L8P7S2_9ACTN|nr:NAD(P)-dependent oxidoreductase [Nocardioides mangrovicus]RLV50428.1 NAD(P)-dependent oxidoreductase [Nocardioides mangrovicus]
MRVGCVGVGTMGGPIAAALAGAGFDVAVHDPSPTAVARTGLPQATPAELAERDVVVLSLPTPEVVLDVVPALVGTTVLDTSTVGPDTSLAAAEVLEGRYADCPVLGRPAAVGRWTIPVGGSQELVDLAAQVLAPVAARVVGVGPTGSAATLKVLNNLMLGVVNAATAEVLALAEASGLDPAVFVDTLVDSGAASVSGLFREVAPRAVRRDYTPTFSVALLHKDNAIALDLARRHGVELPVAQAAQELNGQALAHGRGDLDSIAVLEELLG